MPWLLLVTLLAAGTHQAAAGCKNCISLGKEEKAMFRAHSAACMPTSGVEARAVDAMLAGELSDSRALRAHVYCVLQRCKLVGKDGKLLKSALLAKMPSRPDANNVSKVLESCADQMGDSPEDLAWNLFRCGYDKKALLFDYMPIPNNAEAVAENNF